jgi:hypothetical protein
MITLFNVHKPKEDLWPFFVRAISSLITNGETLMTIFSWFKLLFKFGCLSIIISFVLILNIIFVGVQPLFWKNRSDVQKNSVNQPI